MIDVMLLGTCLTIGIDFPSLMCAWELAEQPYLLASDRGESRLEIER